MTLKQEPQDASPDPLENKTVEELKDIIHDLELRRNDDTKKLRQCYTIIGQTAAAISNIGLDLQNMGRNSAKIVQDIADNKIDEQGKPIGVS